MKNVCISVILIGLACSAAAWDTEELEIFDLVEEINQNFYELLGVAQDAPLSDLKRAFRNLSIVLHPDKNDAEDANERFRNLVSVYEVLKDKSKREKYDKVLKDGLPNWKSALYYYRRVRKLGMAEILAILFAIATIGQYLVAWGVYFEKKYTAEQLFGTKIKKLQKKNKVSVGLDNILSEIPTPSVKNTLPFQIPWLIWNAPSLLKSAFLTVNEITQQELEKKRRKAEELKRQREIEEEIIKQKEAKKELKETLRKRKQETSKAPEKTEEELAGYSRIKARALNDGDAIRAVKSTKATFSGGFWSDEDLVDLVRLVKKYPAGTADRWELIAEHMSRNVAEITFMAAKLKENGYRIPGHTESVAENIIQEAEQVRKEKVKTKKSAAATAPSNETLWTQEQQQALEAAITKYPKASSGDRWAKIANNVPGKTREECLQRYKYLVELVKSQREAKKSESETNPQTEEVADDGGVNAEETVSNATETSNVEEIEEEVEEVEEEIVQPVKNKGKPRNKRKERKKRMEFSSDEDDYSD